MQLRHSTVSKRELWLIGIMLYWAEGTKEKEGKPGSALGFTNSDPRMIRLFIIWLKRIVDISEEDIRYEIYLHENSYHDISEVIEFWAAATLAPKSKFTNIYFKRDELKTNRKNTGAKYYGVLRVRTRNSSKLVRQIAGWTTAVVNCLTKDWGVV